MSEHNTYNKMHKAHMPTSGDILYIPNEDASLTSWGEGAPTDGTSGTLGVAPGGEYIDTTNATRYINSGTAIDPVFSGDIMKQGAAASGALLMGSGTGTTPATTDVAGSKFLSFYCETTTTGAGSDTRAAYIRLYINGTSTGGGEALRAMTTVEKNIGTARGAHISLNFAAGVGTSECSGLGVAMGATLHIPNIASWAPAGTYAAIQAEIYSDGTNSDPAGMTELSAIRIANSGGSGKADVDTDAAIFSLQGWTPASDQTSAISDVSLAELPGSSIALRILVGSTSYHIPAVLSSALD